MVIKWFVTKFNVLKVRPNQPIEPITSQFISLFGPDCTVVRLNQGRTNSIMVDSTTFYLFLSSDSSVVQSNRLNQLNHDKLTMRTLSWISGSVFKNLNFTLFFI
jgi:hypothetical protein